MNRTPIQMTNGVVAEKAIHDSIAASLSMEFGVKAPPTVLAESSLSSSSYKGGQECRVGDAVVDGKGNIGLVESVTASSLKLRHPVMGSVEFPLPYVKAMTLLRRKG